MEEQKLGRLFVLVLALAAICVGAVELAVCRVMDPVRYEQLVTPVRLLYHEKRSQVKGLSEQYELWTADRGEERQNIAAQQERRAQERKLLRRMSLDQRTLFQYMEEHPFVYEPPAPEPSKLPTMVLLDGKEYLTGGNTGYFRYFNQRDERWSGELFGVDPIGGYGCGPTTLAMAVSSLTGLDVDPAALSSWAASQGYAAPGSGSYYSIVQGVADHFGLTCASVELTEEAMLAALSTGGVMVALMGPGHFTSSGHFIALHGVTEGGMILAADPNNRGNSLAPWAPSLLLNELSSTRASGAPLWLLTLPETEAPEAEAENTPAE